VLHRWALVGLLVGCLLAWLGWVCMICTDFVIYLEVDIIGAGGENKDNSYNLPVEVLNLSS
jgi:hypothetical protein